MKQPKLAKQQFAKRHGISIDITNPSNSASSNDALRPDFAERHGEIGEIQEEEDNLECLQPPSDRHIWDGARGKWIREEEYPIEDM